MVKPPLKICCIVGDLGGLNTLRPIIKLLKKNGHGVSVMINETLATSRDQIGNLGFRYRILNQKTYDQFFQMSLEQLPDILIITVSRSGNLEKKLIQRAKIHKIPTISPIENWGPFAGRFSDSKNQKYKNFLAYLPDYVLVVDEIARENAISEGIPESHILITGSTHLEDFLEYKCADVKQLKIKTHESFGISLEQKLVVFASQALKNEMGKKSPEYPGYNETEVLSDVCCSLAKTWPDCFLVIKLHPFELEKNFIHPAALKVVNYTIDKNNSAVELMLAGDLIIGMFSNFLIEAAIQNKPVISYQKGIRNPSSFIGTKLEFVHFCHNITSLRKLLYTNPAPIDKASDYSDKIARGATKRIINIIESINT